MVCVVFLRAPAQGSATNINNPLKGSILHDYTEAFCPKFGTNIEWHFVPLTPSRPVCQAPMTRFARMEADMNAQTAAGGTERTLDAVRQMNAAVRRVWMALEADIAARRSRDGGAKLP